MGTLNSNYLKKWKLAVFLVYILVYFLAYPIFVECCKKLKMSRLAVTRLKRNLFWFVVGVFRASNGIVTSCLYRFAYSRVSFYICGMEVAKWRSKVLEACERIRMGKSLIAVCDELQISTGTFYDIIDQDEKLFREYERACDERAHREFERMQQIADCEDDDLFIDEKGKQRVNHDVIARDALRINTMKWRLSKMLPKKYGEKLDIDAKHSGEIKIQISKEDEDLGV